ncbi:MAG: MFS transporter [Chloroflexi bacterium]|nr:MAG: MFS transporter [Chloroflexota bacterium]
MVRAPSIRSARSTSGVCCPAGGAAWACRFTSPPALSVSPPAHSSASCSSACSVSTAPACLSSQAWRPAATCCGACSWTVNVFQAFTPTWYRQLGYGPEFYGPLATVLVLASAVGTVGCGSLADRYGRRVVILVTLLLTVPAILLYTLYPGPWAFATAILIGFLAASTAPLLLLMAQQLMASRAGLASGLVMGLGFVTGAIGVPINGAIGDAIGLQKSLMTHVILVIATIGIAWFLPREEEIERYAARPEPLRATPEQV